MKKRQLSINMDPDDVDALDKLAQRERRSRSEMAAIIIRQRLEQLRKEYRRDQTLPSLPKQSKSSLRGWTKELTDLYG